MILVGGATRLTDSGLSITEWQPIVGAVPPLSEADWQEAFAKYKQIPEYNVVNRGMSLDAFKTIYWWEWTHRFLGRFIGLAFAVPFLFFWLTGRIGRDLMPKLIALFVLGGLQGALGWWMVMSGLADRVDVSQYRLAAHLSLAVLIFGAIFWVALDLNRSGRGHRTMVGQGLFVSATGLAVLVLLQVFLGGLVAGLDAGQGYNTWPLMDGAFVPDGLGAMRPWYLNLFENALTVQFQHRMAAYAVAVWALLHLWRAGRAEQRDIRGSAYVLTLAVAAQIVLGIWTLVARAPLDLSLAHQGLAIFVFAAALYHLHAVVTARRPAGAQSFASA